VALVVKL